MLNQCRSTYCKFFITFDGVIVVKRMSAEFDQVRADSIRFRTDLDQIRSDLKQIRTDLEQMLSTTNVLDY